METPNAHPWWRYLRLSLRTLLVLILLVAAWLGWIVHHARLQRAAVEAIEKAGGFVHYDWQWKDGSPNPSGELRWPRWLVDRVGVDYFAHVLQARIFDRATDAEMAHIGHLVQLDTLDPAGSPITDAGLVPIEGLTQLLALNLAHTRVTDAGMVHLKGLSRLRVLGLYNTPIGDAGLAQLEGLTDLCVLQLSYTRVTDAGLVHLKGMHSLQTLALGDTGVTDAGLVHLEGLKSLTDLRLNGTGVTDAGVRQLQRVMPKLKVMR